MKTLKMLTAIAAIAVLFTYTSCTTGGGGGFTSKEDSMKFAQAYFDKYPEENSVKVKYGDTLPMKSLQPITWVEETRYSKSYDKKPLIYSPTGVALQGFFVDSSGFAQVLANKAIKGLYLRFGKKDDGSFTIMLLGTDGNNKLIKDSVKGGGYGGDIPSNYDNTPSCPNHCPED
ncbi:hypothetical protein [Ferruginibacter sp. HRS2-29]|uniref:hypothetical protein n=1 Tax=Ferruginibacter sp. HRS2-29 TaxID=2487334 RepID=UPI0020CF2232|nr:hypothetical protein [Ferruginibacter sp. HRS2-29]MCP9752558.1 hypothetical protein [Ferruginibacter sp. HRS2-29]